MSLPSSRRRHRPGSGPRSRVALLSALVMAAACDSGPPPPRATSINLFPAQATMDAVGDSRNFAANVRDQNGIAMTDQPVTWTSSDPSVVSIDVNGRARAEGNGSAVIRATAGEAVGEAPVTVTQVATTLTRVGGDAQEGAAGTALLNPLRVQAFDRLGNGIAGQTIRFEVLSGNGSVDPAVVESDAQGEARAVWTLGPRAGQEQTARAAIEGSGVPGVAFAALGLAGPPAELRPRSGADQAGLIGTPLAEPLTVQVLDAFENPIAARVDFSVISGGGSISPSSVDTGVLGLASASWTLGTTPGEQRARATSGDLVWEFRATAATTAGPPASLGVVGGSGQEGPAGSALPQPIAVVVRDAQGIGVAGVDVTFTVAEGSVSPGVVTSNGAGVAAAVWTLGPTVGAQSAQASVDGLGTVTFAAESRSPGPQCILDDPDAAGFDIQICFVTEVSPTVAAAFESARLRWESLITGDIADLAPNPEAHTTCGGAGAPAMEGATLDDLVIYATIEEIDGRFGVLGSAGPCFVRDPNAVPDFPFLTTVGRMRFDVADLDALADAGQLESVILHEMGHVLGLGTLWSALGFLQNAAQANQQPPLPDTHFDGPLAIAAFDASGGSTRLSGQKVPVHNRDGQGSVNGHWREATMDFELMTPFLDGGRANPLSIITVQSLGDLGYTVSNTAADAYTVPNPNGAPAAISGSEGKIPLVDDILRLPLRLVDREGRVVGILPPAGG